MRFRGPNGSGVSADRRLPGGRVLRASETIDLFPSVDRNGLPFGQIWKFVDDIAGTYHAKTLEGNHQMFNTLEEAKDFMVTTRWWEAA